MTDRRARGGRPLKRKVATRVPRKTLLIFCEGERTEPEYFEALKREPAVRDVAAVDIRVHSGGGAVPLTLVQRAVEARERAAGEDGEIDEFWCVFDVEWPRNHPHLSKAMDVARRHGIRTAVSNPCFELWLALHFAAAGGWLDNQQACDLRRRHDGKADKGLDGAIYMPLRRAAADRARKLEQRHERDGTAFPQDNPSSGMHHLLASVESSAGS